MRNETVYGFEADVVGIHVIGLVPLPFAHRDVRGGAHAGGFGADGDVFAVGLVPDRDDFDALFSRFQARAQLGPGLTREPVSDAQ